MQLTAETFGKLFSEYKGVFDNIAFSYINDSDAAKDIVTDCFMYLWEHRSTLEEDDNIKGYLYMCVRAKCISHIRKRQTVLKIKNELNDVAKWHIESSLCSLSSDILPNMLCHNEILDIFQKELGKLPFLTRNIFLASREQDMTYKEIAEKFNVSHRKVTSEIQHALKFLRHSLGDYIISPAKTHIKK